MGELVYASVVADNNQSVQIATENPTDSSAKYQSAPAESQSVPAESQTGEVQATESQATESQASTATAQPAEATQPAQVSSTPAVTEANQAPESHATQPATQTKAVDPTATNQPAQTGSTQPATAPVSNSPAPATFEASAVSTNSSKTAETTDSSKQSKEAGQSSNQSATTKQTNQTAANNQQNRQENNLANETEKAAQPKIQAAPAKMKATTVMDQLVVTNEQQLNDALNAAPSDGSGQTITLGNSFSTVHGFFIKQGQNITFINEGAPVELSIGSQIKVETGAMVTFKGNQKDGISIVPTKDFAVPRNFKTTATYSALHIDGTADLINTTIKDFNIKPYPPSYNDGPVTVSGGTLTMGQNAYITHNHLFVDPNSGTMGAGGISVNNVGTVIMNEDSYVTNNSTEWGIQETAGGISLHKGSHLIMNGGHIDGNSGPDAGGVVVGDVSRKDKTYPISTMVMNSGTVDGNISWHHSGGIFINGSADVTINSGSISRNQTGLVGRQPNPVASGGAFVVHQGYTQQSGTAEAYNLNNIGRLTINDAIIDGNHASAAGGGLYVNSNNVTINKATITNNVADKHGGGIYVSIAEYTLHLGNSLITGNEAIAGEPITSGETQMLAGSGGGIWFCPTGNAEIYVTDGTAIYGNKAFTQGDEVLSEAKTGGEVTTLANRMLGGGGVDWYHDRDGQQETDPVTIDHDTGFVGLKNQSTDAAKAIAASLATVLIKGNKAPRGGGIGSNGSVIFGNNLVGTKTIKVAKVWENDGKVAQPDKVAINLVLDDPTSPLNGGVIDTIELSAENNWQTDFAGLPTNLKYQLTEGAVAGFTPAFGELKDLENGVFEMTVTNKSIGKETTPDQPTTPVDQPKTPTKPTTPTGEIVPGNPAVIPGTPTTPEVPTTPTTSEPETPVTTPKKVTERPKAPTPGEQKAHPEIPVDKVKTTQSAKGTPTAPSLTKLDQPTSQPAARQVANLVEKPVQAAMPKPAASDLPNEQAAELPQTGDQTSILAVILGISLLIVISGWLVLRRKSCD